MNSKHKNTNQKVILYSKTGLNVDLRYFWYKKIILSQKFILIYQFQVRLLKTRIKKKKDTSDILKYNSDYLIQNHGLLSFSYLKKFQTLNI